MIISSFEGSNPADRDVFLKAIKIFSTTSIGGEVKPLAQCREILLHVKDSLRYGRDTDSQKSAAISRPVLPASLLGVCCNLSREILWMNWE
jgi:hypothetical protein